MTRTAHRGRAIAGRVLVLAVAVVAYLLTVVPEAHAATLLGNTTIENSPDYNPAGIAEAFPATATASGSVTSITVYVDAGSTATSLYAGLYADSAGKPGALLAQGSILNPTAASWDTVPISAVSVTSGTAYWIAILTPNGAGEIHYRDRGSGAASLSANQASNGTLPATWTTLQTWNVGPISAYASDGANGPQISAVQTSGTTSSSTTVTWTTSAPATSQVRYGTTTSYGSSTTRDSTLVSSHSQTLSGLSAGTLYNFQVISADGSGSTTMSPNFSFTTPGGSSTQGGWGPVMSWPLVAVHMNLLHNGKVLLWDGWQTPTPTQVWDPGSQTFTTVNSPSGLFCAGEVQLAAGRILVAGGHDQATGYTETGIKDTNIFDPVTNTWTRVADMHYARWYPSVTLLPDGRVLVVSGEDTPNHWIDTPEVYDPVANTWTLLSAISTPQVHESEYPLSYALPNGKVLVVGPNTGGAFVLDVNAKTWTSVGTSPVLNGSASMYRPGKVLYSGGGNVALATNPAQTTANILDMTAATPAWQSVAPMQFPRYEHSMVDLPDGTVFVVGGAAVTSQTTTNNTLPTEIWDPGTNAFTTMASQAEGRIYHSTAALMPDGRVLVAGGGRYNGAVDHFSAQYFSPPYLFKGTRPTITSAPGTGSYTSSITVQTPDAASIGSVSLINLATATHASDMSQRDVPLTFTTGSGSLSVQLPASADQAPPGYYMLFITNTTGVPSTAAMIQLGGPGGAPQPPSVSMTAPASGASVSGSSVPVSANATDKVAVASVQFQLDGAALGSSVTAAPYQISWDSTKAANGSHQLSAVATNTTGVSATATPVTVTVSNATPPPSGLAVDAQKSARGKDPVTVSGLTTSKAGDWLLALGSSDGPSSGQTLTVSGGGLNWSLVKRANTQPGTAEVWAAQAPTTLSNASITATQSIPGYDEDLTVVAFSGSSGIGASAAGGAPSGAPSVSIRTTGPGSLVVGAGMDWDAAVARTVGLGQKLLDEWVNGATGDTYWSQMTSAATGAAGTSVTINDMAPTTDRWDLAVAEVLAAPVVAAASVVRAVSVSSPVLASLPAAGGAAPLVYWCSLGLTHGGISPHRQRGPQWPANPARQPSSQSAPPPVSLVLLVVPAMAPKKRKTPR